VTGPAQELAGPWLFRAELLRPELNRYLADAARPAIQRLPTRCPAWTVREVTIHLLCIHPVPPPAEQGQGG
jgi:hypothetical protein